MRTTGIVPSFSLRTPIIYGVGASQTSNLNDGSTGINVYCQEKGYSIDSSPSMQLESLLENKRNS